MLADQPRLADLRADLALRRFPYFHQNFARLPILGYDEGRAWIDTHLA